MFHAIFALSIRWFLNVVGFRVILDRVEISTPINSWKTLRECSALREYSISPYESDSCHTPPLYLWPLYYLTQHCPDYFIFLIFSICDIICAVCLSKSAEIFLTAEVKKQNEERKTYAEGTERLLISKRSVETLPKLIELCYLFNPFTVLSCVGRTTTTVNNLFLALTLLFMLQRYKYAALFFLALSAYLELYPLALFIPVALFGWEKKSHNRKFWQNFVYDSTFFALICIILTISSYYLVGSWNFIMNTYGFIFSVPDLTPNVGLFWYFFTETFDHFRLFFLWVFVLNPFIYIAPLSFSLRNEPVLLFYVLFMITTIFKSYPNIGDSALYLSLLPLWSHFYKYMKHSLIIGCALLACTVLAPVMWHLWIEAGSANANFYFAITLVYSTAQVFLLIDILYSFLRRKMHLKYGLKPKLDGIDAKFVLE